MHVKTNEYGRYIEVKFLSVGKPEDPTTLMVPKEVGGKDWRGGELLKDKEVARTGKEVKEARADGLEREKVDEKGKERMLG